MSTMFSTCSTSSKWGRARLLAGTSFFSPMEWSNEKTLEFIDLYRSEPCLWWPKHKHYKSRTAQSDAWRRIKHSLSFATECDELKKKKDSLLGYYRIHRKKYNKSVESPDNDVYVTNWFAFDKMNSFLCQVYANNSKLNTESRGSSVENDEFELTMETGDDEPDDPLNKSPNTPCAGNSDERDGKSTFPEPRPYKRPHYDKTYTPPEIVTTVIKTEDDFEHSDTHANHRKHQYDEYDYFALMLASKIRKIKSEDDREVLMNSIQNLAFQFYMKNKKNINS